MTLSPAREAVAADGDTGFSGVAEAAAALARGEVVLIAGEAGTALVAAAGLVTGATVRYLAAHGGPVGCALPGAWLGRLRIPAMVAGSDVHVGVAHRSGGAAPARTLRALADPGAQREDFRVPGPVFPTRTRELGVLENPGLADAAVDLARIAGVEPVAAFVELDVAAEGLPWVTVSELIAYRHAHERLVERAAVARLPLPHGGFRALGYRDLVAGGEHVALVHGELGRGAVVRVHVECPAGDAFGARHCGCARAVHDSLAAIAAAGSGVLVYVRGRRTLWAALTAHRIPDGSTDRVADQILRDLGVRG
ncbi:3,4-dihydroxy-2-butanone-4-phosphate synthase [Amycolatopsis rhabdoformis]|uniref:3,4-dihydroxy-2-butanone-4-phosphate synthase n=1 Tax=Amycolatopsis rhabdoformis TaxID=1448059 RepID=A0ABZ1IFF5_9PSEU|nr:3,4-dihydroxy-2-butanone-4-phosphate synthase [Amycolatopsis rhabdoformis]WSE32781.1 3,4-dihydroxy-2-butanone-4-phosphate synthase [Amycolatopsis rhabdoformis]